MKNIPRYVLIPNVIFSGYIPMCLTPTADYFTTSFISNVLTNLFPPKDGTELVVNRLLKFYERFCDLYNGLRYTDTLVANFHKSGKDNILQTDERRTCGSVMENA